MARVIFKYKLEEFKRQQLEIQQGAEILCVDMQGVDSGYIWALVDPDAPLIKRMFEVVGTGQLLEPVDGIRKYIGTYQSTFGHFVFHCFEII